jgi:hypothetical protein
MLLLQVLQFAQKSVVFAVCDGRTCLDIVQNVMVSYLIAKGIDALPGIPVGCGAVKHGLLVHGPAIS